MLKDNIIICLLAGAAGIIFIASLPSGELIKLQPTMATFFAFLAALIGYFSKLNSIHEEHLLAEQKDQKEKSLELHNFIHFIIMHTEMYRTRVKHWSDYTRKKSPTDEATTKLMIKRLEVEIEVPSILRLDYSKYKHIDEISIKAIVAIQAIAHLITEYKKEVLEQSPSDQRNFLVEVAEKIDELIKYLDILLKSLKTQLRAQGDSFYMSIANPDTSAPPVPDRGA